MNNKFNSLNECCSGGDFICHSIEQFKNKENNIIRFDIIDSHKMKINNNILIMVIIDPIEDHWLNVINESG